MFRKTYRFLDRDTLVLTGWLGRDAVLPADVNLGTSGPLLLVRL